MADLSSLQDFAALLEFKIKLEKQDESIIDEINFFNSLDLPVETVIALNTLMHYVLDRQPAEKLPFLKRVVDNLDALDKDYFYAILDFKKIWMTNDLSREEKQAIVLHHAKQDKTFKCDFNFRHYYGKLTAFACYILDEEGQRIVLEKIKQARFEQE